MLLTNYIRSAWRNILRHKLFSIINIMGLAIGLAAVMLIALFVRYETSYDSFWNNADNIYRLHYSYETPGQGVTDWAAAPPSIIGAMKENFPEIEKTARIAIFNEAIINNGETYQTSLRAVDPSFVEIFEFDVIAGDIHTAVNGANGMAISRAYATRVFGDQNPIGESFTISRHDWTRDYVVGAVFEDIPENSRFEITAMIGYTQADWATEGYTNRWYRNPWVHSYFTLSPGAKIADRFPEFIDRTFPMPPNSTPPTVPSDRVTLSYQNLQNLHLNFIGERELTGLTGNKQSILMFSAVALLILGIASINFMNLSTARATQRAKEVGIRKVVGAARRNLINQFIGESVFLTLIALVIAFGITELMLPFYNDFIGKNLSITYISTDTFFALIGAVIIGLAGGTYPAFVISAFRPSQVLKSNKSTEDDKSIRFRSALVLMQFSISIFLFVSTAVIFNQFRMIETFDYGYNPDKTLMLFSGDYQRTNEKFDVFNRALQESGEFAGATGSTNVTFGYVQTSYDQIRTADMPVDDAIQMEYRGVSYDFFELFEIPILAGRSFGREYNDERATYDAIMEGDDHEGGLILNQSALRSLNLGTPEDALGKLIYMAISADSRRDFIENTEAPFRVVGVVPDVQHQTLKHPITPAFYQYQPNARSYVNLRYSGDLDNALAALRKVYTREFPETPYDIYITDLLNEMNYGDELTQMTMFAAFSGLAIFIACLGLFGLASFTAERRTKEIGIRKVFGAEVWQIVRMLVFQFSKPVLIANVIAWPIAYLAMSRWLESFVYRIDDMVIIALCLVAGLTALLIAWATVAGNSYAVARQNPIKALRYE